MIRFRDTIYEDYFIDEQTGVITDRNGNVVNTYVSGKGYVRCKGHWYVHQVQVHTKYGYKQGWDVHHLDEDKTNNALSNLVYLPHSEHIKQYHKESSRRFFKRLRKDPFAYQKYQKKMVKKRNSVNEA